VTVKELIAELRKMPPEAPVYVFDGDQNRWETACDVWRAADPPRKGSTLPPGAVAIGG
jgi:hypothetical protein